MCNEIEYSGLRIHTAFTLYYTFGYYVIFCIKLKMEKICKLSLVMQ